MHQVLISLNQSKVNIKEVNIKGKRYVQIRDKKTGRFIATNKKEKYDEEF